ncbi:MAG: Type II secretion system protein D [Flavobacterium sp. SCGC AAA160-P02]|nr:MAG: Type II secretion system protein D [Flavobacterium sp. SCGC AAA160-P02]
MKQLFKNYSRTYFNFLLISFFFLQSSSLLAEIKVNDGKIKFINESGKVDELIKNTGKLLGIKVFTYGDYKMVNDINITIDSFEEVINHLMGDTKYIIQKTNNKWKVYTKSSENEYKENINHLHKTKYTSTSSLIKDIKKLNLKTKVIELSKKGSIIISGSVNEVIETVDLINSIDLKSTTYTIELLVVEYKHNDSFNWGIDINSASDTKFSGGSFSPAAPNGNIGVSYNFTDVLPQVFKLNLQALVDNSTAEIFQNPRITVESEEEGKVDIQNDKYVQLQTSSINGLTTNLQKLSAGIKLVITPKTLSDDLVELDIEGVVSEFIPFSNAGEYDIETNTIKTKINMKEKQTLVIGGLIKEETTKVKGGFPLLKDIPGLDLIFSRKVNRKEIIETVIYITVYKKNPYENNRNVLFDDNDLKNQINIKTN